MRRLIAVALMIVAAWTAPAAAQTRSDNTMTDDQFWSTIGQTTAFEADPEQQLLALRRALDELEPVQIEAFERAFHRQQLLAYSWDL